MDRRLEHFIFEWSALIITCTIVVIHIQGVQGGPELRMLHHTMPSSPVKADRCFHTVARCFSKVCETAGYSRTFYASLCTKMLESMVTWPCPLGCDPPVPLLVLLCPWSGDFHLPLLKQVMRFLLGLIQPDCRVGRVAFLPVWHVEE